MKNLAVISFNANENIHIKDTDYISKYTYNKIWVKSLCIQANWPGFFFILNIK